MPPRKHSLPPPTDPGSRRLSSKGDHIRAALDGQSEVSAQARPGALAFDHLRFLPSALPEIDLASIDLSLEFLGKRISAPLMIAPMTGGLRRGAELNRCMAAAAEATRIPFGVGSQRVALEVPARAKDFDVRRYAPTIPVFANLGAIQLRKGFGSDHALRAVEMVGADALFLHLNAMQEAVQEGGDTEWTGVLRAIGALCDTFARQGRVPVFAREVGFGVSFEDVRRLLDAGVSGIDCAGGGGTSWTLLEGRVAKQPDSADDIDRLALGKTFAAWGLTTPEAIREVRRAAPTLPLIASGGVRSGLDVARAVALGATLAAMASPVLRAATAGPGPLEGFLKTTLQELRLTLFGVGAPSLEAFRRQPRLLAAPRATWAEG